MCFDTVEPVLSDTSIFNGKIAVKGRLPYNGGVMADIHLSNRSIANSMLINGAFSRGIQKHNKTSFMVH